MFRTAIKSVSNGSFRVIQTRDILIKNDKPYIEWSSLAKVNIETSRAVNILHDGQLLVVTKGPEKHIIRIENVPENVVCTQHFLTIEPTDKHITDIEFVEFILTSDVSQKWLASRAGGNYQSVISKSTFEQLPFPDVDFEMQKKAIDLKHSIEKEQSLLDSLITARLSQKNTLVNRWLNKGMNND